MDIFFFILHIIGRILFGGFFVWMGINHFVKLQSMTGYAASKKVPFPREATIVTGIMMILGGLSVLAGFYVWIGLILVGVFLLVTSFVMHRYWTVSDPMVRQGEKTNFLKNLALVGIILLLLF